MLLVTKGNRKGYEVISIPPCAGESKAMTCVRGAVGKAASLARLPANWYFLVMPILVRFIVVALSLWLAAYLVPGFRVDGWGTLALASLLFGVVNAVLKPVLVLLTFPITLLTLGLFLIVLNAAMLGLVAWLLPGFAIDGLLPALLGWLIVTVVGWAASQIL